MNIIFGKYQLTITQTDDSGRVINNLRRVGPRFEEVCGFGRTRIRWILAQAGCNVSTRIGVFMRKKYLTNRELIVSKMTQLNCFQYVGVELLQLYSQQRLRKYRFLTSFRLARAKVKGKGRGRDHQRSGNSNSRKKKKLLLKNMMKVGLDRYRYVVTIHEYCDFCLELLARSAISQSIKAALLQTCGTHVKASYTRFTDTVTKSMIPKFRRRYKIRYTLAELNDVMERAQIEYERSDGDLDSYLSSDVVREFKVRFMGNQLDNWELIEDWVNLSGLTFPDEDERYEVLGSMDLVIDMPAFDIYDVAPVVEVKVTNTLTDARFNSHYWRYFKAPISVCTLIARECPGISVRFNPTKFMLLGYSLSYIAFDHRRYFTNSDKYKSIFKLIELVFGNLTPRELIWVTHSVYCWAPRLSPARGLPMFNYSNARWDAALESIKHLSSSEPKYRAAFESLEIIKGIEFVPEAREALKIYRSERKISK